MSDPILVGRDGAVATLTLNRPDRANTIDAELAQMLGERAHDLENDEGVRCVVIAGAGRFFCAGGDVPALCAAGAELPAFLAKITRHLHAALLSFARMKKPVVTVVHGPAAGAGVGLACVGDVVLASSDATFNLGYSRIGLSPDGGATWLLPRLIGLRPAQDLCLTNRRVSAQEAEQIGLITRAVAPDVLREEADELARSLADAPVDALGLTKRLLLQSCINDFSAQLEAESKVICAQSASQEALEGIAAFIEKRSPSFS